MHIYPSSPNSAELLESEESAAIKIQAGFRGYRVRKQALVNNSKTSGQFCGYQLQHHHYQANQFNKGRHSYRQNRHLVMAECNSNGIPSSNVTQDNANNNNNMAGESNTVEDRCATKIQASVRGFLVRKKQKIATDAATKIQAGFRGFKARKEAQKLKHK